MSGKKFTHLDAAGRAQMVNVMEKEETKRRALATGRIFMESPLLAQVEGGGIKKGSVLGAARIAGIMAVKRTSDLIPLCHPLPVRGVEVEFFFHPQEPSIEVQVQVEVVAVTGVEMEALTGVSVALLTIYDMCKGVSYEMELGSIYLLEKEGGLGGFIQRKREEGK